MIETPSDALSEVMPVPFEGLVLLDGLSGREGSNRSRTGHRQVAAEDDREALLAWLARYADSPNTLANSRREAERLVLWSIIERHKPLSSLTHEDLLLYQRFLADPRPVERWVMQPGRKLPRTHPGWRPFAGRLSPVSVRQAMVILNAMFSWLVQAGYLAGNPLSLSRQRRNAPPARVVRFLDEGLWTEVRTTITQLPKDSERDQGNYSRARWLFSLLYLCGLRISEVTGNHMGSFHFRVDTKSGRTLWWLDIVGKGGKQRLVPATDELVVELMNYRKWLQLPALPQPGELSPLVFPVAWRGGAKAATASWPPAMSRAALHRIVKDIFARTAERLRSSGPENEAAAARVKAASSHWLRHTMGSRLADHIDLRHVRDTFGHSSLTTTSVYLHAEEDARHAAINANHKLRWDSSTAQELPAEQS